MESILHFMFQIMAYASQAAVSARLNPFSKANSNHQAVLVSLSLPQNIAILLQRTPDEFGLFPEVRCEETVGIADSHEGSFECVFESLGGT